MESLDPKKIEIARVPWNDTDISVRYAGHYAGAAKLNKKGEYRCAVHMERNGEYILQECGMSNSEESAAQSIIERWLLSNPLAQVMANKKKFFIPEAEDKEQEERVYSSIKEFLINELGALITERKIHAVSYKHEGKYFFAEVGKVNSRNQETVIAILFDDSRQLFLICTPNQGVVRGTPIMVGIREVDQIVDFE